MKYIHRREMTVGLFALFHFLFLGIEYYFDGQMAYLTDAAGIPRRLHRSQPRYCPKHSLHT